MASRVCIFLMEPLKVKEIFMTQNNCWWQRIANFVSLQFMQIAPFIFLVVNLFPKNDLLIGTLFHQTKNSLKKPSRNGRHKPFLKLKETTPSLSLIPLVNNKRILNKRL